jgi:acetyltransferase-like isoleucine patch superfamily enzyme
MTLVSDLLPTRDYVCNAVVNRIPICEARLAAYRALGVKIGEGSTIMMWTYVQNAGAIRIGSNTVINPHCDLDGRGGLVIGNNVNISAHVIIVAGFHDIDDGCNFQGSIGPVTVEDYAWICVGAKILPGVRIGRGAVVAAGSVVTNSVSPNTVVGGVPARKLRDRPADLSYTLEYQRSWM